MDGIWSFLFLLLIAAGMGIYLYVIKRRIFVASEQTIRDYKFPDFLYGRLRQQLPDITKEDYALICQGLRQFLLACNFYRTSSLRIPSHCADLLWHEFILCHNYYQSFCSNTFNGFLHHRPYLTRQARNNQQENLMCCWHVACADEGISALQPDRLPLLFQLDQRFAPPQAIHWEIRRGRLHCRRQSGTEEEYPIKPLKRKRSRKDKGGFDAICCEK